MIEYLQSLSWQQQIAGGGAAAALIAMYWKDIKKLKDIIPSMPSGGSDVKDLQALKLLEARGDRLSCVEFQEAVKALFRFFFHDESKNDG